MQLIRALHRRKYDKQRKRFSSDSFKDYNRGISVIDPVCVETSGAEICQHLGRYYENVVEGRPFAYWIISVEELRVRFGDEFSVVKEVSVTDDECHRNIVGIGDGPARAWSKKHCRPPHIFLCVGNGGIPLTKEQFERLHEIFDVTQ